MPPKALREAEDEIAAGLRKLASEGGSNNFLIVSSGDFYIQFAAEHGAREVWCEAVSNSYLPAARKLSLEKINELKRRGFAISDTENFSRKFPLAGEEDARKLAGMAVEILERAYGCSSDSPVKIELNLE